MSAGDLSISRTSSSPSPSSSSSSSSYQHSAPRQRRAQPWHVFPVRVRSSRSSGSRSDVTETAAPPQSRRRSADGHGRHGSDARPRSSRRDNSSSATAGSTASGRWSLRTHTSSLGGESSMLPGVEFARRRRVHSVGRDGDSPGGGFGLVDGRPSRARPGSTVAHHHHHYHHHHHHHHHHHYHQSASEQAATRTRSSSGGRLGGLRTAGEAASNEARPSSSRRQGASSSTASNTEGARSERAFRLPTWMQRSSTTNNLREEALEARDRLDERLRAAALVSQSARRSRTSLPGHPQADYSFVVPEADEHSSNSDEDVWETSMREWLAAWAPAGTEDRFRHDISSRSTRMERPKGISKATIGALPREMYCTRAKKRVKEKGSCEQEECPVCLEHFVVGEVLLCLPCNHRFHPDCLTPWLESHGQCPYCRGKVPEAAKARGTAASTSAVDGVPDGEDLVSWMTAIERGITRLSFRVSNY